MDGAKQSSHAASPLPAGKLPAALLGELLETLPTSDPQLLLAPAVGEDAAVIDFAPEYDKLLVAKSDPITFATDEIGYYAVNVCTNDLAVTGAIPRFYLPTLLLPAGQSDADLARKVFDQIGAACRQLGIVIAGGHTEITPAVNQPVVAGTLLGEVERHRYVTSAGCRPGDAILMAGVAPTEAVSIIAREKRDYLVQIGFSRASLDTAAAYLHTPGISILQAAHLAVATGHIHAMHDPTEGGIATGLQELASASNIGLRIDLDVIPIPQIAHELCAVFNIEPLGAIASGALLVACAADHVQEILQCWRTHNFPGAVIGQAIQAKDGLIAQRNGEPVSFPSFAVDEITKLWPST